jgi:hypothetical protein
LQRINRAYFPSLNKYVFTEKYINNFGLFLQEGKMGVLNFFKKKQVPDELPELATDEIEERLDTDKLEEHKNFVSNVLKEEEKFTGPMVEVPKKSLESEEITEKPIEQEPPPEMPKPKPRIEEEGFFSKFENNLSKEIGDLDQLESWYKQKFLARDIVSDMRNYWEGQKNNSVIKILGRNFQERISERTEKLQELEKEWQNVYFDLIEKEEEIREQEKELKKLLSEFVEVCKRRKKSDDEKSDNKKSRVEKIM